MRSVSSQWVTLAALGLVLPLACGGRSQSTPGDAEPGEAGKGNGASAGANPKPSPAGGSTAPGTGGAAPAGGMASGGLATGGFATGGVPGGAGSPGGAGGMPVVDCSSSGGASLAPLPTFAGTKNAFGFALRDSYFLTPCLEVQGHDCLTALDACPNQDAANFEDKGRVFSEQFQLEGCLGKTYSLTFKVNGVVEGKYYSGGMRRNGEDFSDANDVAGGDGWYVGGTPIASGYNVFKMTVLQPDGETEVQHYYLNAFPQSSGLESHQTVLLGYEATIDVPGQGVVRLSHHDSNCRAINNCGPGEGCPAARHVPNEPGLPVPATYGGQPVDTQFNVVNGAQQPYHAQMVHITVTNVAVK